MLRPASIASLLNYFAQALVLVVACYSATANSSETTDLTKPLSLKDSRHLLARTGIGVSAADLIKYRGLTRGEAINNLLADFSKTPAISMPSWVSLPVPRYYARKNMDSYERSIFNNERNAELAQLRHWWTLEMLQTNSPQTEKMVLFWHDIFASSFYGTDRQSLAIARQNQTFREMGMGSWSSLLKAMIRDPALMEILNAGSNHKDSPNENLARELMKLFTLGEGNYDEFTVKEAARALTGHGYSRVHNLEFRVNSWHQDRGIKNLFGIMGNHTGDDLVGILLQQPSAASFLATKFWNAFIADSPPDNQWLTAVAASFRQSDYEVSTLYRNTLESDAFWRKEHRGSMIKSPVDIIIGTARTLEYPKRHWRQLADWQSQLGMELFAPPNVSGWHEGLAFITTGRLLNRYKLVDSLAASVVSDENLGKSGAGAAMSNSTKPLMTDASMMSSQSVGDSLQVRIAAENYRGAPSYQVSLYKDDERLWQSKSETVDGGHETELYGRVGNLRNLNWHTKVILAPEHLIAQANRVEVTKLSDDAGPGGDRNLYVDGILIEDQWLSGSRAMQEGSCVPKLAAQAWKMYCIGTLTFTRAIASSRSQEHLPKWRASAAHIAHANKNKDSGVQTISIMLDDFVTPTRSFHTFQFSVIAKPDNPVTLRLEPMGCWPECIELWPTCGNSNQQLYQKQNLYFPRVAAYDRNWLADTGVACHYQSLSSHERGLVAALWNSAVPIIEQLKIKLSGQRFEFNLSQMLQSLAEDPMTLNETLNGEFSQVIDVDLIYKPFERPRESLIGPETVVDSLSQWQDQIETAGISPRTLLLPEMEARDGEDVKITTSEKTVNVRDLLRHPLFQLK